MISEEKSSFHLGMVKEAIFNGSLQCCHGKECNTAKLICSPQALHISMVLLPFNSHYYLHQKYHGKWQQLFPRANVSKLYF